MQNMKEMTDTGYIRAKDHHLKRTEKERRDALTQEEKDQEDWLKQQAILVAQSSRARITDLNEEKTYVVDQTLEPQERSFLIQPEKPDLNARMPAIFSQA